MRLTKSITLAALALAALSTPAARAFVTFTSFGPNRAYSTSVSQTLASSYDYALFFTPTKTVTLNTITFPIQIFNTTPATSFTFQLQANSASNTPGQTLATYTVPYFQATPGGTLITVTQSTPLTLTAGTTYWFHNTVNSPTTSQAGNWFESNYLRDNYLWLTAGTTTWQKFTGGNLSGALEVAGYVPGDVNDDGLVNADDYALIDRGFAKKLTGRSNGNLNSSGHIDAADYLILDTAYLSLHPHEADGLLTQRESQFGEAYAQSLLTSLPEPTSLLACLFMLPTLLTRRRPLHSTIFSTLPTSPNQS